MNRPRIAEVRLQEIAYRYQPSTKEITMSTERKPGSRGVKGPFGQGVKPTTPIGAEPDTSPKTKSKGTTKTVSPRQSYKKRKPRK